MNSTIYKQTDTRWSSKAYPSGSTVGGCGCGLLACTHVAMEQESKKNWTPDNLRSWMVNKGFAIKGQGTRWEGITETLKHIGHKSVVRVYNDPMSVAWKELNKGNRIGVLLFNSRTAPNGVKWTASGHYVAFTGYKVESGKHFFYTKDSGGRNHSGWYSYENSMKGCIAKVWIVERVGKQTNGSATTTTTTTNVTASTYKPTTPYKGSLPTSVVKKGSKGASVKAVQTFLNWCINAKLATDSIAGTNTVNAIKVYQKTYGLAVDGIFGSASKSKAQKIINAHEPPTPSIVTKELDACKVQANWMKNSKYEYESHPTIEKSKKKGTCVTYVACVLQRIGVLKSGQNLWHTESGKVYGNNSKMTVVYPKSKTLHQLKSQLKAGDIIMDGSGVGSNSHIFILTGKWSGSNPIIWDNHSGQDGKGAYTYTRNRHVIAYIRLK